MDIINRERKGLRLSNFLAGECFRLDGFLYIKTDRGNCSDYTSDCVKLSNGCKESIPDDTIVEEVEATIITGETPTTLMQKGVI